MLPLMLPVKEAKDTQRHIFAAWTSMGKPHGAYEPRMWPLCSRATAYRLRSWAGKKKMHDPELSRVSQGQTSLLSSTRFSYLAEGAATWLQIHDYLAKGPCEARVLPPALPRRQLFQRRRPTSLGPRSRLLARGPPSHPSRCGKKSRVTEKKSVAVAAIRSNFLLFAVKRMRGGREPGEGGGAIFSLLEKKNEERCRSNL